MLILSPGYVIDNMEHRNNWTGSGPTLSLSDEMLYRGKKSLKSDDGDTNEYLTVSSNISGYQTLSILVLSKTAGHKFKIEFTGGGFSSSPDITIDEADVWYRKEITVPTPATPITQVKLIHRSDNSTFYFKDLVLYKEYSSTENRGVLVDDGTEEGFHVRGFSNNWRVRHKEDAAGTEYGSISQTAGQEPRSMTISGWFKEPPPSKKMMRELKQISNITTYYYIDDYFEKWFPITVIAFAETITRGHFLFEFSITAREYTEVGL